MRLQDLCYMTSATYTEPTFTTASVTGYNDFQDWYAQDETFVASFKDGSNNYMVAVCSLNGSNQVIADQVIMSSSGPTNLTVPTFSGTVDIVIGSTAHNSYQRRFSNCQTNDISQKGHVHMNELSVYSSGVATVTADQLFMFSYYNDMPGWYYGFYLAHKGSGAGTGDYYMGLYDINEAGDPDTVICTTGSTAHANANAEIENSLSTTLAITAITQATPGVVTYTGTDPANGDRVYITGANNITNVNQISFLVSNVDTGANTFELQDLTATNYATTGSAATTGTVHFPLYIAAGDYILGMTADTNNLRFTGAAVADELGRTTVFGVKTGAAPVVAVSKAYTYAALPTAPDMSTGWSDDTINMVSAGLMQVEG